MRCKREKLNLDHASLPSPCTPSVHGKSAWEKQKLHFRLPSPPLPPPMLDTAPPRPPPLPAPLRAVGIPRTCVSLSSPPPVGFLCTEMLSLSLAPSLCACASAHVSYVCVSPRVLSLSHFARRIGRASTNVHPAHGHIDHTNTHTHARTHTQTHTHTHTAGARTRTRAQTPCVHVQATCISIHSVKQTCCCS